MTSSSCSIVCYPFVGDTVGGSHISMMPVIRGMREKGFAPLVAVHHVGPLTRHFDEQGMPYVLAPSVKLVTVGSIPTQIAAAVRAVPKLVSFLRRHDVRIVHTNDKRMHLTWILAARLAGCRFVWHQRSADPSRRLGFYCRFAHAVLTISEFCRRSFAPPMAARARVINDPFDTKRTAIDRGQARRDLGLELRVADDVSLIGYVGNLTEQKRPLFFVDIAAAVRTRLGPAVQLLMFGEKRFGLAERVERAIATYGLEGQCRLMGPRYPIEPAIAACDILVAPAKSEGLGRTLVEAMLVGTPVVAADDAGHREAIRDGDTGRLVVADDSDAFADAVVGLLRDRPSRDAMAARARDFATTEFATDRHLACIASVYNALMRPR